jgi:pimeloyl-ACP methyl ester carboxylesterase
LVGVVGHVEDLERLRAALGAQRITLVGHGMGGYLAMKYAVAHPDRVGGLSLVASVPARGADARSITNHDLQERFHRPASLDAFREAGVPITQEQPDARSRYLEHRIAKGAANLHHVERWGELEGTLFYNPRASDVAGMPPLTEDLTDRLAALRIPIQVLYPADDITPLERGTRWVVQVPNATLEVLQESGHVPWIDQPKGFSEHLERYLRRVVGS